MSFDALTRRQFVQRAIAAGTAIATAPRILADEPNGPADDSSSPNEKLNIGVVGVAARGHDNLVGVASENIVALCDIDEQRLDAAAAEFPKAARYRDYRKMLDRTDLDAVVVSTPDHTHAIPVVWALKSGRDVYCEKPLARTVAECREMRNWAKRQQAVTQMGTQIHAGDNYRRVVEIIRAGLIGEVRRVHMWQSNSIRPGKRVDMASAPPHVDYDLWIGPAPMRPFHPSHFHFNWRYWWDFGGGILADMGCHYIDLPYWALGLRYPDTVEARGEKNYEGDNNVPGNLQVDYHFAATERHPEVHLTWYHGTWKPEGAEAYEKGSAVLFEGEHGRLLADYGSRKLFFGESTGEAADVEPPAPTIPNSIGHHREWIEACKSRSDTTCNFDYSGALAETVLLGNVAYRAGQKKMSWSAADLRSPDCAEAEQFVHPRYRKGWTL